jgi:hypothetical protein
VGKRYFALAQLVEQFADVRPRYREAALAAAHAALVLGHGLADVVRPVDHDGARFGKAVFGIEPDQLARSAVLADIGLAGQEGAGA